MKPALKKRDLIQGGTVVPKPQNKSKTNLSLFLDKIRKTSKSEREKGFLFEKAVKGFLKESPEHNFEDVWLWSEWKEKSKYKFSGKELGVDLVAKEKETGKYWAVQCKCYDEKREVNKKDVDSFFTQSGKEPFSIRLIVASTNRFNDNVQESIKNQSKPTRVFNKSDLEKREYNWLSSRSVKKQDKKRLREHQLEALNKTIFHFKKEKRGKLVMACGAGKTLTSLHIAENLTSKNGHVLFLAPSIALVSQTIREYAYQRSEYQRYLVVCSDKKSGKDSEGESVGDLQIPPTTNPKEIAKVLKSKNKDGRTIVFATYQSLKRVREAQKLGAPKFDLVICDEAHKTTGIDDKMFTQIHDEKFLKVDKRLYMTATPKIYSAGVKKRAKKEEIEIHSMDDESTYGKTIHRLDFSEAIEKDLLTDYKAIILNINEEFISDEIQNEVLADSNLTLGDASKLIGCYKALRDQGDPETGEMLSRAVAFINTIKNSKEVKKEFYRIVKILDSHQNDGFTCETEHVDGQDNSLEKSRKLDWLKEEVPDTEDGKVCRLLTNAKCLTEGVDVPSLDAVMFLHPRKSQVDIVQAVGRVMRKAPNKKYGYIILPVVIPKGKLPHEVLEENKGYEAVWQVLRALRSHDSHFNTMINNLELNEKKPPKIKVVSIGYASDNEKVSDDSNSAINMELKRSLLDLEDKVFAKIVENCGDRVYEEKWSKEIVAIHETITTRIESLIKKPNIKKIFDKYVKGVQASTNEDIGEKEAISMLAEHLITRPAFDKIFEGYEFSKNNPISQALKDVLDELDQFGFRSELKSLEGFYDKIGERFKGIDNSEGKQKVIKELYENFIKTAFPKTASKLGVAYTPIECVDFILESANHLLEKEFKTSLTEKDVHVIDPFVGTGTFINRLISNKDLIKKEDLERKFKNELHANEILLLPYYVASINIEEALHDRLEKFLPFDGIALTDTFNMYEERDNVRPLFKENRKRIKNQKRSQIRVILGNPPYSVGQDSENDGNKNTTYPKLHERIEETYVEESDATNNNSLYDSYIKSIRWATDRIGEEGGVVGFIHNASLLRGRSTAGLRRTLSKEFDAVYSFDLRGNLRTKGEQRKKECSNVFGQNSRAPIAITFLVKNPENKREKADIFYFDIGDYLSREEKLSKVKKFGSVENIDWLKIKEDKYGDWLNQRDDSFYEFLSLGDKKDKDKKTVFSLYGMGVGTSRDSWAYNFDKSEVQKNMKNMIDFYNGEIKRLKNKKLLSLKNLDKSVSRDESKISWSSSLKSYFLRKKVGDFDRNKVRISSYRPFIKSYLYFDRMFNERVYQNPKIWRDGVENRAICINSGSKEFSCLITDTIPNIQFAFNGQCFPLYHFDKQGKKQDAITDWALEEFQSHYKDKKIKKEDIFYYIYGVLHSPDYRKKYATSLTKSLPHIPFVKSFWNFSKTGRELADLHVDYENVKPYGDLKILKNKKEVKRSSLKEEDFTVKKMKDYKEDPTKVDFNESVTISNIPKEAWNYKVNGYAPLRWIVERYKYKVDKDTGHINDPNTYSENPRYVFDLFCSLVTVSMKTQELIKSLPKMEIEETEKIETLSLKEKKVA